MSVLNGVKKRIKSFRRRISYSKLCINTFACIGFMAIWLLSKTLRLSIQSHPEYAKLDRSQMLFAFWHGRQFLLVPNFGTWGITIMTDTSWAGEIQARILRKFGYFTVRGSSSRHGVKALIQMKKAIAGGSAGAFAVDGPRGPVYQTKQGIIYLAQKMQRCIIPVTTSASKAWILKKTWCQYLLPKPFSKCVIVIGRPLPRGENFEEMTEKDVDRALKSLTYRADQEMGVYFYPATRLLT